MQSRTFVNTVKVTKTRWLELLFGGDLATCKTALKRTLGQVP
jgi:hypothetical protein